jgi:hypothetical protein
VSVTTAACVAIIPGLVENSSLEGKAISVSGPGGAQGYETSGLPHFLDNLFTDGGEVVSLTRSTVGRPLPSGKFLVLVSLID